MNTTERTGDLHLILELLNPTLTVEEAKRLCSLRRQGEEKIRTDLHNSRPLREATDRDEDLS